MGDIEIIFEGSATSGNRGHSGIPGHQGGSLKKGQRNNMPEDTPSNTETPQQVTTDGAELPAKLPRSPFKTLAGEDKRRKLLINRSVAFINIAKLPSNYWFYRVLRDETGKVDCYIVGHGNRIYSVLNRNSELLGDKRPSQEIAEAAAPPATDEPSGIDLVASIQYQLQMMTDEEASRWCALTGNEEMGAGELAAQWDDWSIEGLSQLLFIRSPESEGEEEGETDAARDE